MHALLTHLPTEQRRIIELRLVGLTSAEIGQVLGLRRGTVDVAQIPGYQSATDAPRGHRGDKGGAAWTTLMSAARPSSCVTRGMPSSRAAAAS